MNNAFEYDLNDAQQEFLESKWPEIGQIQNLNINGSRLSGPRDAFRELREKLTHLLAVYGFNKDESLTGDGQILEDLIDFFYTD